MFKHVLSITIFFIFTSCNNKTENINLQKGLKSDTAIKASKIIFSEPQAIDSSSIVIYPLILEKTIYRGSSSYGGSDKVSYCTLFSMTQKQQRNIY